MSTAEKRTKVFWTDSEKKQIVERAAAIYQTGRSKGQGDLFKKAQLVLPPIRRRPHNGSGNNFARWLMQEANRIAREQGTQSVPVKILEAPEPEAARPGMSLGRLDKIEESLARLNRMEAALDRLADYVQEIARGQDQWIRMWSDPPAKAEEDHLIGTNGACR